MEKIINFMEEHLMPIAGWISEQPHLRAIRDAGMAIMPLLLVGSLFLIIANPPIPYLAHLIQPYKDELAPIIFGTFGIMALGVAFSLPYSLAKSYHMDALSAGIISLSCFIIANPMTADNNINMALMGGKGFFVAMLIGFFVVEIMRWFVKRNITIKLPDGVPPTVSRSFAALIPAFVIITLIWLISMLLKPFDHSIPSFIDMLVTAPLLSLGGNFFSMLAAQFAMQMLWSFGIHGSMLVMGIMGPVLDVFTQTNAMAANAGQPLPNIITRQFAEVFILMGGSGMTLPLAFMMLLKARSSHLKLVGRTSIWPGLFNINEPITFGIPIVLNPIMMIPFIMAPLISTCITYFAMSTGMVKFTYAAVPWTTPLLFSGFLSTGDWRAVILQIILFIVCTVIYYPFFKTIDDKKYQDELADVEHDT